MKMLKVTGNNSRQKIVLCGDRKSPEPPEVSIQFPGGCVSVCRTTSGKFWMHFSVHHDEKSKGKLGEVVDARIDYDDGTVIQESLMYDDRFEHMAILVEPRKAMTLEEAASERNARTATQTADRRAQD
jgi:hypothetical protein